MAAWKSPDRWRVALVADALISIGAAAVWLLDGERLAEAVFGADPPDAAHVELARKGGLPFMFIGVQALWLAAAEDLRAPALLMFHRLHLALDGAMLALGSAQLATTAGGEVWWTALVQVVVALVRICLRLALLSRA